VQRGRRANSGRKAATYFQSLSRQKELSPLLRQINHKHQTTENLQLSFNFQRHNDIVIPPESSNFCVLALFVKYIQFNSNPTAEGIGTTPFNFGSEEFKDLKIECETGEFRNLGIWEVMNFKSWWFGNYLWIQKFGVMDEEHGVGDQELRVRGRGISFQTLSRIIEILISKLTGQRIMGGLHPLAVQFKGWRQVFAVFQVWRNCFLDCPILYLYCLGPLRGIVLMSPVVCRYSQSCSKTSG